MATYRLVPSTYSRSNTNYVTVTNPSNMYTNTDSTTMCSIRGRNSSNTSRVYYCYVSGFNFGSVPSSETVASFKVKIKAYKNSYQRTGETYRPKLASTASSGSVISGTTLSEDLTTDSSGETYEFPLNNMSWNTLKNYGSNFSVIIPLNPSSNQYPYVYVYGIEIEVITGTPHNITVTNSTSATVTANPTTVYDGGSSTITADTLSNITITDNNTDVTNQFTQHSGTSGEYSIETRGSYGFTLSNGYYVSQNKGVDKSCAVARISFNLPVASDITFTFINYAEATYDFGVFGNVDVALTTNYYPAGSGGATISETSYKLACNTSTYNKSTTQTLTYSNVSAGDHFIDVKFSKDDGTASNNDTLQFQVDITYSQSVTYYTYTINNITTDHTIVVSQSSSGPKFFVKINGTWTQVSKIYKKVNGSWVEQASSTWSTLFNTSTNYRKME